MAQFDANDFQRLQNAQEEINQFGEFLKDRLITMKIIKGEDVPRLVTLRVPNPLKMVEEHDERTDERLNYFHLRQSLGGDRFGEDFREHYLPVDFTLGGAEADAALREDVENYKRLVSQLASTVPR